MPVTNEPLVLSAESFARTIHAGQVRANVAREPLTSHLREVAAFVQCSGGTDEEIAAAWLHDSVEDTATTIDEIIVKFGIVVGALVDGLTDPPEFEALLTRQRKELQAVRLHTKNRSVKRVKIADQTSNLLTVTCDPPIAWNKQECLDYIEGAQRIALECYGISKYLDFEFLKAYHRAVHAHR